MSQNHVSNSTELRTIVAVKSNGCAPRLFGSAHTAIEKLRCKHSEFEHGERVEHRIAQYEFFPETPVFAKPYWTSGIEFEWDKGSGTSENAEGHILQLSVPEHVLSRIAIHEAGHIVAGCINSVAKNGEYRLNWATCVPHPPISGEHGYFGICDDAEDSYIDSRLDDFQSHLDEAVFAWGGEVAEHLLLRTSHLSEADQGNIEKVWEHYSNTSIDKSIKSQGRKETTELLTLHLGTLWHVAKQLSEQLVLTRQEITCLLQLEL